MNGRLRAILLTVCVAIMLAWSATSASAGQHTTSALTATTLRTARPRRRPGAPSIASPCTPSPRVIGSSWKAGDVHHGSIQLGPDRSAGDIEIGSYGKGRAIIDAGTGSGIVIENLSGVKISVSRSAEAVRRPTPATES